MIRDTLYVLISRNKESTFIVDVMGAPAIVDDPDHARQMKKQVEEAAAEQMQKEGRTLHILEYELKGEMGES